MVERRHARSGNKFEALRLYLGSQAARRGAKAMAIGTLDGLLVAGAGAVEPALVTAVGSLHFRGRSIDRWREEIAGCEPIDTVVVPIGQAADEREPYVVTTIGGARPRSGDLDADVTRILAERLPSLAPTSSS
jgi:hypothetical protein